jgi:hypothetical protein
MPVEKDARGLLPLLANLGGDDLGDDDGEETRAFVLPIAAPSNVLTAEPAPDSGLSPQSPLPETIHASLEVMAGPAKGVTFRLSRAMTTIGRAGADFTISDPTLSRQHASVLFHGDHFRVRDDGGRNATYLNGAKVREYNLRNGDTVMMGQTMLLFRIV